MSVSFQAVSKPDVTMAGAPPVKVKFEKASKESTACGTICEGEAVITAVFGMFSAMFASVGPTWK